MIEKILPVVDNFERGLAAVPEDEKDAPFVDGMDKIYKQLLTDLEDAGCRTDRGGGPAVRSEPPQRSDACGG